MNYRIRYAERFANIEAVQHFSEPKKFEETNGPLPVWVLEAIAAQQLFIKDTLTFLKTKNGDEQLNEGDWILRLQQKEFLKATDEDFKIVFETIR